MSRNPCRSGSAHGAGGLVAQDDVALQARAAQVEVAVFEAHGLGDLHVSSIMNGGVVGGVEDAQSSDHDFDGAGGQVGVGHALGARGHPAAHADDVFAAQRMGFGVVLGVDVGVEDHLGKAFAVPQVDKMTPPWSRRRCTQPMRTTSRPSSCALS
jgi:hypothetical protein